MIKSILLRSEVEIQNHQPKKVRKAQNQSTQQPAKPAKHSRATPASPEDKSADREDKIPPNVALPHH
ncbi:MAG TPA: hypothetical protein DSN98_01385 [Thermoplasmata archaeon]|nr:MAG TPA: hypothetical protein DSN98_01385 [Thermoplasmata archaeon]